MEDTKHATKAQTGNGRRLLFGLVAVVVLVLLGRQAGDAIPRFAQWIEGLGPWAPIAFIAGYAAAAVAFVPGSLLTLAGGAIFGLLEGTLYVFIAASLGACAAFLVARYVARSFVEQKLRADSRFAAIDSAVAREGRKIVFLLRLSPLFPYNLLNYALGLTKVGFVDYAVGCAGMLPATFLYVYYGKLAGDVAAAAAGRGASRGPADYAILVLGLLATIAVTALVTRSARRALAELEQ